MSGLCLVAGLVTIGLGADEITLTWRHSVEKQIWEEDWRRVGAVIQLTGARVRGSGAGMEMPPGAVLRDGAWHWRPAMPPVPELVLRRSDSVPDWRVCTVTACRPLGDLVPVAADPVVLKACAP
jgi:hypothetical protein